MRQPATRITPNLGNRNQKIDWSMVQFSSVLWIFRSIGLNLRTLFLNMPVFHNQLSHQEIELIHGYIPLGSPSEDRWAFPMSEILEEYSNHWQGEWNQGCKHIMGNIVRALESGALSPLTRHNWREYLCSNNCGKHAPSPGTVPRALDFTLVETMIDNVFPVHWHDRRICDIFLPEEFSVLSDRN